MEISLPNSRAGSGLFTTHHLFVLCLGIVKVDYIKLLRQFQEIAHNVLHMQLLLEVLSHRARYRRLSTTYKQLKHSQIPPHTPASTASFSMADPVVVGTATARPPTSDTTCDNASFAASKATSSGQASSESYSPTTAESTKQDEACSSPVHQRLITHYFAIKGKATGGAVTPAKACDKAGQQGFAGAQQPSANKFVASFQASADDTSASDAVIVTSAKPGPRGLGKGLPARTERDLTTQVAQKSLSHESESSAPAGTASPKQTSAISRTPLASTSKPVSCAPAATEGTGVPLSAAAAATPGVSGRTVSASNEVKSLVAFAWDRCDTQCCSIYLLWSLTVASGATCTLHSAKPACDSCDPYIELKQLAGEHTHTIVTHDGNI